MHFMSRLAFQSFFRSRALVSNTSWVCTKCPDKLLTIVWCGLARLEDAHIAETKNEFR